MGMELEGEISDMIGFRTFFGTFLRIIYALRKIISGLIGIIFVLGIIVGIIEGIGVWNGIYLAFVSALTVGYGDIVPTTPLGKVICVLILPVTGMLLTGIMVAAALRAIEKGVERERNKS